jgi:hypothetical protein
MLKHLGIVVSDATKAGDIFETIIPDFRKIEYEKPSEYIKICWDRYLTYTDKNNNLNGKIFEYILATLCVREGLLPLYLSAKVAFVPNVLFDILFYCAERGPICWSVKTSLRERYKQADLESTALKYVHRKSLSYLITLEAKEAKSVKEKIRLGDVIDLDDVIGLDDVIVATNAEFDELVQDLKKYKLAEPPTVTVITSNQNITYEKVKALK